MIADEKMVKLTLRLPVSLFQRWRGYMEENPVWKFHDLIAQLLRQHFDEADEMKQALTIQEGVLQYRIAQKKKLNPSQGEPPG